MNNQVNAPENENDLPNINSYNDSIAVNRAEAKPVFDVKLNETQPKMLINEKSQPYRMAPPASPFSIAIYTYYTAIDIERKSNSANLSEESIRKTILLLYEFIRGNALNIMEMMDKIKKISLKINQTFVKCLKDFVILKKCSTDSIISCLNAQLPFPYMSIFGIFITVLYYKLKNLDFDEMKHLEYNFLVYYNAASNYYKISEARLDILGAHSIVELHNDINLVIERIEKLDMQAEKNLISKNFKSQVENYFHIPEVDLVSFLSNLKSKNYSKSVEFVHKYIDFNLIKFNDKTEYFKSDAARRGSFYCAMLYQRFGYIDQAHVQIRESMYNSQSSNFSEFDHTCMYYKYLLNPDDKSDLDDIINFKNVKEFCYDDYLINMLMVRTTYLFEQLNSCISERNIIELTKSLNQIIRLFSLCANDEPINCNLNYHITEGFFWQIFGLSCLSKICFESFLSTQCPINNEYWPSNKNNCLSLCYLSNVYFEQGDYDASNHIIEKTCQSFPKLSEYHKIVAFYRNNYLCTQYIHRRQFTEAENVATQFLYPFNAFMSKLRLCEIELKSGNYKQSLKLADKIIDEIEKNQQIDSYMLKKPSQNYLHFSFPEIYLNALILKIKVLLYTNQDEEKIMHFIDILIKYCISFKLEKLFLAAKILTIELYIMIENYELASRMIEGILINSFIVGNLSQKAKIMYLRSITKYKCNFEYTDIQCDVSLSLKYYEKLESEYGQMMAIALKKHINKKMG